MKNTKNYYWIPYLTFIVIIFIGMSVQLIRHTTIVVADGYFHFTRIYDAAQQIKTHNFSYFQMNWGFDQSGRIVNAVYGPIFTYFLGALLLLSGTWFKFQILTTFLISFFAAIGMYQLMKKVNDNLFIDTLISSIYLCMISWWNQGTTFGSISAMLIPYVLLVGIRMIKNWKDPVNWLQLGVTMSLVSQIHLMSTILFSILLIPFTIAGFCFTTNKKGMIGNLLGAILLTLFLTANIWMSLIYLHSHDAIAAPVENDMVVSSVSWADLNVIFLGLAIFQIVYVIFHFKESLLNDIVTLTATIFLIGSTNILPWGNIQRTYPILQRTFQIPKRLMIEALPLLFIGIGLTIKFMVQRDHNNVGTWCAILIVMLLTTLSTKRSVNKFYTLSSLQVTVPLQNQARANNGREALEYKNVAAPDYLPQLKPLSGTKTENMYTVNVINRKNKFAHDVLSGGELKLSWYSKTATTIKLPIVMYKDSHLNVNGHELKHVKKNEIGVPTVKQRLGRNNAILSYDAPRWWTFMLGFVGICWVTVIGLLTYRRIFN